MKRIFALFIVILLMNILYAENNSESPHLNESPSATSTDATLPEAIANLFNPLLEWFMLGGALMYFILALSIIALAVIIERAIVYRREKLYRLKIIGNQVLSILKKERRIDKSIAHLENIKCRICDILAKGLKMSEYGIERVEKTIETQAKILVASLENKLNILSAVSTIAPLLGFLGTVAGMISAFQSIANAEQVNARIVASGIFEALITTEYGLIVAIPVFFITNYFYHRVDTFASEMERIAEDIVNFKITNGLSKLKD